MRDTLDACWAGRVIATPRSVTWWVMMGSVVDNDVDWWLLDHCGVMVLYSAVFVLRTPSPYKCIVLAFSTTKSTGEILSYSEARDRMLVAVVVARARGYI